MVVSPCIVLLDLHSEAYMADGKQKKDASNELNDLDMLIVPAI